MRAMKVNNAVSTNSIVQMKRKATALALSVLVISSSMTLGALAQETSPAQAPVLTQPAQVSEPTGAATPVAPSAPETAPAPTNAATPSQNSLAPTDATAAPAPSAGSAVQPTAPEGSATIVPTGPEPVEIVDPEKRNDIPHDLSPWGMFMAADWVVKGVMIGLAAASVLTWTVLLAKTLELIGARSRATRTLGVVRESKTLNDAVQGIANRGGPAAMMVRMASHEMKLSDGVVDFTDGGGIKERVTSVLNRIEVHAGRRMARGTGVLATIGSISPFVGLFGTVWGIMNSFISISESQTTNLAIVAPGIAEALLATAIGLVAAIPAVVFYNIFARAITGYRHLLADVASGVERLVSRDIDYRRVPPGAAKPNVTLVGR